jgi:hypothetical protein
VSIEDAEECIDEELNIFLVDLNFLLRNSQDYDDYQFDD